MDEPEYSQEVYFNKLKNIIMTKELTKLENNNDIQKAIEYLMEINTEVPFGNSDFQNQTAIVNWELTPYRALRHSSLRINDRLQALNECYYNLKENDVKIRRIDRQIERLNKNKPEDFDLDVEDLENEKAKILSTYPYTQKLIKDAIQEINSLSPVVESIWKITREQFESEEKDHFIKKLLQPNEALRIAESYDSTLFTTITNPLLLWT